MDLSCVDMSDCQSNGQGPPPPPSPAVALDQNVAIFVHTSQSTYEIRNSFLKTNGKHKDANGKATTNFYTWHPRWYTGSRPELEFDNYSPESFNSNCTNSQCPDPKSRADNRWYNHMDWSPSHPTNKIKAKKTPIAKKKNTYPCFWRKMPANPSKKFTEEEEEQVYKTMMFLCSSF